MDTTTITIISELIGLAVIYFIITYPIKTELKGIKDALEKLAKNQNKNKPE